MTGGMVAQILGGLAIASAGYGLFGIGITRALLATWWVT